MRRTLRDIHDEGVRTMFLDLSPFSVPSGDFHEPITSQILVKLVLTRARRVEGLILGSDEFMVYFAIVSSSLYGMTPS